MPTLVILACALLVTVPAVVADVAVLADVAKVALATVPVTLAPVNDVNKLPLPITKLPVTLPLALTVTALNVLAVITLAPEILPPAPPPVIKLLPIILPLAEINPPVNILAAVTLPLELITPEFNDVNVPTLVMVA